MFWFVILVIALAVEFLTTTFISMWFALGALTAFVSSALGHSFPVQLIVFIVVSIVALILSKPYVEKKLITKSNINKDYIDSLIDNEAVVTIQISNLHDKGEVLLDSKFWTARSLYDEIIPISEKVYVKRIVGEIVIVSRIKEEPEKITE